MSESREILIFEPHRPRNTAPSTAPPEDLVTSGARLAGLSPGVYRLAWKIESLGPDTVAAIEALVDALTEPAP